MVESGIAYPEAPILTFPPCAGGRDLEATSTWAREGTSTWAREGTLVTRKKCPAIKPGKGKVRLLPERRLIRHPLSELLQSFLDSCDNLPDDAFQVGGRFSAMVFESVFVATCAEAYSSGALVKGMVNPDSLRRLRLDPEFYSATQSRTTATEQVRTRLSRAYKILSSD